MKTIRLCFFLTAVLLMMILWGSALAATSNGYTYEIVDNGDGKHAYLTGYTGTATTLTMPSSLGGYPVWYVSNQVFSGNKKIQSVTIPGSYRRIDNYAFQDCTALRTVRIQEGLSGIGLQAFDGCSWLTSVNLPDSVTNLWGNPFSNCQRLSSVDTSASSRFRFNGGFLLSADGKTLYSVMTGTSGACTVPDGVEMIAQYAAAKCVGVTEFVLPESLKSIGEDAFHYCSGLTRIELPAGVLSVGRYAFRSCTYARELVLHGGITSMGEYAFADCGFRTVTVEEGVTVLGSRMLMHSGNSSLESVTLPASVISIGAGAFPKKAECVSAPCGSFAEEWLAGQGYGAEGSGTAYTYRVIHEWGKPVYAWEAGHTALTACRTCSRNASHTETETRPAEITVLSPTPDQPGSAHCVSETFENEAFQAQTLDVLLPALSGLNVLVLPEDLQVVENGAFAGTDCEAVLVPTGCRRIEAQAFAGCEGLLYLSVPAGTEVAADAFSGCPDLIVDRKE